MEAPVGDPPGEACRRDGDGGLVVLPLRVVGILRFVVVPGKFDKRSSAASTDHGVMVVAGTSRKMWNTEKTSRNVLAPYCKITMVIPTSQNTINNLVNSPP